MEKTINLIRKRCAEKLITAINTGNENDIEKYETINTFLINNRCFLNVNRIIAISILQLLDYSENEAYSMYEDLISYENIKGELIFVEDSKEGKIK